MRSHKHFGEAVRRIRDTQGFTQDKLGKRLGISSQYLSNAERGLNKLPTSVIRKLARDEKSQTIIWEAILQDYIDTALIELNIIFKNTTRSSHGHAKTKNVSRSAQRNSVESFPN